MANLTVKELRELLALEPDDAVIVCTTGERDYHVYATAASVDDTEHFLYLSTEFTEN